MNTIKIKPLSINKAWRGGRRFKTNEYKDYEKELIYLLPELDVGKGELGVSIVWGFSNKGSDIDNPAKPFIDILQKKYDFNDKRIYHLELEKVHVKKGEEFIAFEIRTLSEEIN